MIVEHHREGAGPPLVLLHGVGHHWQGWSQVIPLLAGEREVIAADSPGFGGTPPLPSGVTPDIDAYTDFFVAWFAELGLQRPHVAGNSMGGAIGLELARRGAARSVTAISPAGFWTARERRFCQASLGPAQAYPAALLRVLARSGAGRTLLYGQVMARPWRVPPELAAAHVESLGTAQAFGPALAAFDGYTFHDAEQLRDVPVTIAWGTRDWLLIPRQARRARRVLPWAEHVTLDGLGHTPMFDDPQRVADVVLAGSAGE